LEFSAIKLDKVAAVIELNQIGHSNVADNTGRFYVHTDNDSEGNRNLARTFLSLNSPQIVAANNTGAKRRLPPTSASSFIQVKDIPAVVISDYESQFSE
jgi:hypothetical protein